MGEFVMNNIKGFGDMIYFNKNVRYTGFWENNKKEGFGIEINYDKNVIYIGFWKNNKKEGCGKIMNEKSEKYGYWKNNKLFQNINNYNLFENEIIKTNSSVYLDFFSKNFESIKILCNFNII
jgi:hypothetical protein